MGKDRSGQAHLSYYASAYNMVKTNQLPEDILLVQYVTCVIAAHQFL